MNIEQLEPKPTKKVKFSLSAYKKVPKISGCYVLTTFDNNILYIGKTVNLFRRFQRTY